MQHTQKKWFFEEKKFNLLLKCLLFRNSKKNGMWRCAPSNSKWNKIKFVLSVKLWEEIGFLQEPQKAYIFYAIRFLYISQKKSLNKLCLEPHDTYVLFRTFFSHINIEQFFFYHPIPLNTNCNLFKVAGDLPQLWGFTGWTDIENWGGYLLYSLIFHIHGAYSKISNGNKIRCLCKNIYLTEVRIPSYLARWDWILIIWLWHWKPGLKHTFDVN